MERLLEQAIGDGAAADAVVASSEREAAEFWRLRESLSEIQKQEGGSVKHDVSVPVAKIPELIERGDRLIIGRFLGHGRCRSVILVTATSTTTCLSRSGCRGATSKANGIEYLE